jgi:uncharacterized membrane protein YeaQ/YmgE (transglycosylase-associated protein family)
MEVIARIVVGPAAGLLARMLVPGRSPGIVRSGLRAARR